MVFHAHSRDRGRIGFTLVEILVVVGVIAVLVAVLLPALNSALRTGGMAKSQSNLKQIATWMTLYSSENREFILPSQFDYLAVAGPPQNFPVKVRSNANLGALRYQGTWTDILWTYNNLGSHELRDVNSADIEKYVFDSPDKDAYESAGSLDSNVMRAAAPNSFNVQVSAGNFGTGALPFGNGASEIGLPGFFAANDFFNARPDAPPLPSVTPGGPNIPTPPGGRWYVTGQIKAPERSMYLVDSYAGETIEPLDPPYDTDSTISPPTVQVDFRYNGACLMMFLDGHSEPQTAWDDLMDLQNNRKIKVQKLDRN